jgi:hypothetical protein
MVTGTEETRDSLLPSVTVIPSGAANALDALRRIASKTIALLIPCRKSLTLANDIGLSFLIIVVNPIPAPGNITRYA